MSRKRTIQKNIRLSSEEAEKLSSFAAKAGVSEGVYIRKLIANPKHVFTDEKNNLYRLYREYKRQGVLLGKIARAIEDGSFMHADSETLTAIEKANARIADAILDSLEGTRHADR